MDTEKSIDVLNTLIKINNDRIEGYETASNETDDEDLKSLFSQLAQTSYKCRAELVTEVNRLGGTPVDGTKLSGKVYRVWMDIRAALAGKDMQTILNLCEYGEDAAIETYERTFENYSDDITPEQRTILKGQYLWLKTDHDKIKALRDNLVEHK
ncbi:MAG TPA: PA2169 family four-helix-bundle protein [Cyclobacteriaceae bacterium]